jgi:chaperone BCS1
MSRGRIRYTYVVNIFSELLRERLLSFITTDFAFLLNRSRNDRLNSGDANKKTLYYTPGMDEFLSGIRVRVMFRRQYQARDFSSREEISISCFGRSQQILRVLVSECNTKYINIVRDKFCLYQHQDDRWTRSVVVNRKCIETVVLNESENGKLLKDTKDFLNHTSQR